jgi:galactokinase
LSGTANAARPPGLRELAEEFVRIFGSRPRLFRAPGRVNLIGEHTDYNDGFVMPAAIRFNTTVAAAPRTDPKLVVRSLDFGETREYDLGDPSATRERIWADYVRGVALEFVRERQAIAGANLLIHGDVPMGAGLSSSASVEVATALALTSVSNEQLGRVDLALACQRAENEFVGARCGIMDQFVSANARAGHALLLDCRSLRFDLVPLPAGITIVICNTMVKHQLSGGEYNERRAQCEEGVRVLQGTLSNIRALRDVSSAQLEQHKDELQPVIYRRCRHVVTENERVLRAAEAFRAGNLEEIGSYMAESHRSLRHDYEVSCPELDTMVEIANQQPGLVGARMTGGGFGGCTVNLVRDDAVEQFRRSVAREYTERMGITPEIYTTPAADGATELH